MTKMRNIEERNGSRNTVVKSLPAKNARVGFESPMRSSQNGKPSQISAQMDTESRIAKTHMPQFAPSHLLPESPLRGNYESIIGTSPQILEVLKQVDRVANTIVKVLICGETGTGKELIARALHQNSDRSRQKMISVNCAAIPEMLLENELFGHERGAFTDAKARHIGKFEQAHKGTLFLDEIGDMPFTLQAKLLRVIEAGEIEHLGGTKSIPVDVRIVAATHCNLARSVANGTFRKDLYYRLNAVSITLPSLRERQEDIGVLAEYFVKKHCQTYTQPARKIVPETLTRLQSYPWPGNVRELENALISAVLLSDGGAILPIHLPEEILAFEQPRANFLQETLTSDSQQATHISLGASLKAMEEAFIRDTLAWQHGNRTKTAKVLGISVRTLQNRLKDYERSGSI